MGLFSSFTLTPWNRDKMPSYKSFKKLSNSTHRILVLVDDLLLCQTSTSYQFQPILHAKKESQRIGTFLAINYSLVLIKRQALNKSKAAPKT